MKIKFLKAGTGDSILIQHNNKNILIDGGNEPKFLLSQVSQIRQLEEKLDLLIITHHDDDHIRGILELLNLIIDEDYGKDFIKEVVFNSPRKIMGKISRDDSNNLSYKQAFEVENLLTRIGRNWKTSIEFGICREFEDLKLTFFGPTTEILEKYSTQKGAYLTGDYRCDWNSPMATLEEFIDDASLDTSLPNKTSVVVLIEHENSRVLLTADSTPDRLEDVVNTLIDPNTGKAFFSAVKLPHHGSYRSLSKGILEKIDCNKFIISTNSQKHFLPNKRAILKILKFLRKDTKPVELLFNYEEALNALKISDLEKKKYKIELIKNNEPYGVAL
ncbi:ComEC/Rec2 family competence protein [Pedobacter sp. SYSU D00535]|uniref:ComEC/Rec2 family competence protein n=1 Tax=Pedobacter sp. SYSU D00535 TaxID=2810308 RepID=UPI001A95A757|nr:MBL fold metallo-hydrolase [Pedobacter sp. SYSU D00535]